MSFCSLHAPSSRFSHLVHSKGETPVCTMALLNPPLMAFLSSRIPPSNPELLVAEAVQTAQRPLPPSHWNTKAAFTSAFWWPSEGNVIIAGCSMLYPRGAALYLTLSQVLDQIWGVLTRATTQISHLFLSLTFPAEVPVTLTFSSFITDTVTCADMFSIKENELEVFLQVPPEHCVL